jgi:hypothetical protein
MPPRRSARVAAVAERGRDARSARVVAAGERAAPALAPLPHALVLHILSLLPVDTRLRCAEVCRSWRAALEDRSLWLRLDLSASGVNPKRFVTGALLRAALARARGELVALDISGCRFVTLEALLAAVTANGGPLRELRTRSVISRAFAYSQALNTDALEALLRAAPRLAVFEAEVQCHELALAHRVLHNEAPFTLVHAHTFMFDGSVARPNEAAVVALAADLASHAHLQRLQLRYTPLTAAALEAVVDAALTRRLMSVALICCNLSPASAPALVRLIGGALAELHIYAGLDPQLLNAAAALALGNALRSSSTLTAVSLRHVGLWLDLAAATALLGALTGHPSLRSLSISDRLADPAGQDEAGAAVGALVAANAPALTELNVSECSLRDAGLRPLFDALPANTHLRKLDCCGNVLSDAFARATLLPAVRANSSLRQLRCKSELEILTPATKHALAEAEALVAQRTADR